jgi:hypothetical protein
VLRDSCAYLGGQDVGECQRTLGVERQTSQILCTLKRCQCSSDIASMQQRQSERERRLCLRVAQVLGAGLALIVNDQRDAEL